MVKAMHRFFAALSPLLWTWAALALGVVALSVGHWLSLNGSGTELVHMLTGDTLLLVRALPLWCLLTLPLLALSPAWLLVIQGILGTLFLVALAGLDVYFSMAGVPLGADLFAYSWQEVRKTALGAQVSVPPELLFALMGSLGLLWGSLWWQARHTQPVAALKHKHGARARRQSQLGCSSGVGGGQGGEKEGRVCVGNSPHTTPTVAPAAHQRAAPPPPPRRSARLGAPTAAACSSSP
jgi:hypothetical protein